MRVALVDVAEHFDRVAELAALNWAETGFDFPLAPDVALYQRVQDAGVWFALAAFDGDTPIGYSTAAVTPMLFNPAIVACASDALFVHPDYRKSMVAGRLILATEHEAQRRGAVRMLWHTRAGTELAATMRNHGYRPVDEVVMKTL